MPALTMRGRYLMREYWSDSDLFLKLNAGEREVYIGLWMLADDAGWMPRDIPAISAALFRFMDRVPREAYVRTVLDHLRALHKLESHRCGCIFLPAVARYPRAGKKSTEHEQLHQTHSNGNKPIRAHSNPSPDVLPTFSLPDVPNAGAEEWDGRDDLEAWVLAKHRIPTPRQREWLDRYCDTFDVTGPQRAAKIILSHPDDPIAALKADRDAFLHERAEAITVEPKPSSHRSGSGLTGVSAELAKMWRQQEEGEEA